MKQSDIRPLTTYIGDGGELRKVAAVTMDVAGALGVTWKGVGKWRGNGGGMPLSDFAKWAKTISETLSPDLKHYLVKAA